MGVNDFGECVVFGFGIGQSEVEIFWKGFLCFFVDCGLCGVQFVIVDDYSGFIVVVDKVLGVFC